MNIDTIQITYDDRIIGIVFRADRPMLPWSYRHYATGQEFCCRLRDDAIDNLLDIEKQFGIQQQGQA